MLWASGGGGGGYPGVTSIGPGDLKVSDALVGGDIVVPPGRTLQVQGTGPVLLLNIVEGSANDGLTVLNGVSMFGAAPPAAPIAGGAHTAGGTYTVVEQAMLEACYTALQSIGLVT